MKKAKQILSILLVCCFILLLSSCGGNGLKKKIIGEWVPVGDDGLLEFISDGTVIIDNSEGKWVIIGDDTLQITINDRTLSVKVASISSAHMTLEIDGDTEELRRIS